MSSLKRKLSKSPPMFERDAITGQLIPLPLNLNGSKKINEQATKKRLLVPSLLDLKPLKLTAEDFEEPQQETNKRRKIDTNPVRKGLFNTSKSCSSLTRRSGINCKKVVRNKQSLMDLEEVEEELLGKKSSFKGYHLKSPKKYMPSLKNDVYNLPSATPLNKKKISKIATPKYSNSPKNVVTSPVTPKILSNIYNESIISTPVNSPKILNPYLTKDFIKLERICETSDSPITSISNLLEGTRLRNGSTAKKKANNSKSLIKTLNLEKEAFLKYQVFHEQSVATLSDIMKKQNIAFQQYEIEHEKNMQQLNTYLATLTSSEEQENIPHSNKKQLEIPIPTKNKPAVSPIVTRSQDLLKSTLKKNFAVRSNTTLNRIK